MIKLQINDNPKILKNTTKHQNYKNEINEINIVTNKAISIRKVAHLIWHLVQSTSLRKRCSNVGFATILDKKNQTLKPLRIQFKVEPKVSLVL